MISVLIARQLHWESIINIFKIAMGGLLHDIGMKDVEPALLEKDPETLNSSEAHILAGHSLRGLENLRQLQAVPSDVIHIVLEHHEECNGQGLPAHLKKNQIHPLARLVAVANEFCYLAMKGPRSPGLKPKEAIQKLVNFHRERLDKDFVQALAGAFRVEVAGHPEKHALPR